MLGTRRQAALLIATAVTVTLLGCDWMVGPQGPGGAPGAPPTVSLAASPNPVDEGHPVTMRATLSRPLNSAVTVPLTLTPGTSEPGDYGRLARITIPANSLTGSGRITTMDDADTDDETLTIALGNLPLEVTAGSPSSVTVTINDRTPPPSPLPVVSITGGAAVTEGDSATFTVHATPAPASALTIRLSTVGNVTFVDPARRGIATLTIAANTSSAVWRVATIDDDVDEPDGSVTAALRPGTGYTVGSPSSASVTVIDNDAAPPVVSFSSTQPNQWGRETRVDHVLGAEESVDLLINLSKAATQPLSIEYEGYHSGSVTIPAGALSATIVVPLKDDYPAGTRLSTGIGLVSGDGYRVGARYSHKLYIIYLEKRYASCDEAGRSDPTFCGCSSLLTEDGKEVGVIPEKCVPEPLLDPRCPYPVKMADGGRGTTYQRRLLAQVSTAGTLCATANAGVSPAALDRVSRASAVMLQHRPDLVAKSLVPPINTTLGEAGSDIIVLYAEDEDWCTDFPEIYADQFLGLCDSLHFQPSGAYGGSIIMCPENDFAVCVQGIALSIYVAASYYEYPGRIRVSERQPVIDRFAELDVANRWSGLALESAWVFFAEMSAIYFCVGTKVTSPEIYCAAALRAYDPATYEVIHGIYRGSADLR